MDRIVNFLIFGLLVLIPHDALAWSTRASQTCSRIRGLALFIEDYRTGHGKLPSQEHYQEELRSADYPYFEDGYAFIDMWHRRILYKTPGKHGDYDLYSVGEDGIDNGGDKDDISSRNGANEGYHWKRWWPLGRITLIATLPAAFLILLSKAFRPWWMAGSLAGVVIGLGTSLGCFCLMYPGRVPSRNFPLSIGVTLGLLILLSALWKLLAAARRQSLL